MTKEIIKTRTSKNAETLGALYIYIYIYRYSYRQVELAYSTTHIFYRNVLFAMLEMQSWKLFIQLHKLKEKNK